MGESRSDILRGTLDLTVLETLDQHGPLHGYGLAHRIESLSDHAVGVNQGTIYLCLVRLVQKGWISASRGRSENNRRAKFYASTRAGRKQLRAETDNWARIAGVTAKLLNPTAARP